MINQLKKNWKIIFLIILVSIITFVFNIAQIPQFLFLDEQASNNFYEKIKNIKVILEDDVMISMRVSKFFLENGFPGFNLTDISQPSTSYIYPIIISPLFMIFPDNIALVVVVAIGLIFFVMAVYLIIKDLDLKTASILTIILFLNATTLNYLFSGWELIWQPYFIILSWYYGWKISEKKDYGRLNYSIIGISSALSVLIRPDSLILILPLMMWVLFSKSKNRIWSLTYFSLIGISFAILQYEWFGNLTPTSARLKAGELPDLSYSFNYFVNFCILSGGAALLIPLLGLKLLKKIKLNNNIALFALFAIISHYVYSFLLSDVFVGGRMYLSTLILVAFVLVKLNKESLSFNNLYKKINFKDKNIFLNLLIILAIIISVLEPLKNNFSKKIVRSYELPHKLSPTAEHLILTNYIKKNFKNDEGSIGLFYLGTASFYLQEYEIADFLGKADENIANLKVKWGPPGHNKWSTELSLNKWKPVLVIFDSSQAKLSKKNNIEYLKNKEKFAFTHDFNLELKKRGYIFCKPLKNLNYGIYVRKDKFYKLKECKS
tara:strand:+ start:13144 stop:14787 length:1644 start_codon:yes stop_codon:yes gene_type:complete